MGLIHLMQNFVLKNQVMIEDCNFLVVLIHHFCCYIYNYSLKQITNDMYVYQNLAGSWCRYVGFILLNMSLFQVSWGILTKNIDWILIKRSTQWTSSNRTKPRVPTPWHWKLYTKYTKNKKVGYEERVRFCQNNI